MKTLIISAFLCLAGCSSLLPHGDVHWNSFEEAQQTFDKIIPYKTTVDELKALGLDPYTQANITVLNYSDVLRRFTPNPSINPDELDAGVKDCIMGKTACKGYEIDQKSIKRTRQGNFWADFLNFKREVNVTGWRFNGMLLIKDQIVVYKLISGQPMIHELEGNKNPLGPLQGGGESAVRGLF